MAGEHYIERAYIACSLTRVPLGIFADYAEAIHAVARRLEETGLVKRVSYALVDSDPDLARHPASDRARLCFQWDRSLVEAADLIIGEVTFPSLGVGIELGIANELGKPAILFHLEDPSAGAERRYYKNPDDSSHELQIGKGGISLMALGLPCVSDVTGYERFELLPRAVAEGVQDLLRRTAIGS
jgi:hypothetical protein